MPTPEPPPPVNDDAAKKSVAAALASPEFADYAPFDPYLERVALFRGTALMVKFRSGKPAEGGQRPFQFQKAVVSEYRRLTGEA